MVSGAQNLQPASASDDLMPRVSWRGDGQLFAISSINPSTGKYIVHADVLMGMMHNILFLRNAVIQMQAHPSLSVLHNIFYGKCEGDC